MGLGDYLLLSKKKNKDGKSRPVYSVTNSQGFIPSEEYFSKEVYSKELRTYQVVKRNMIAYNPSRINVGSVALQNKESEVIVSPLYVVFSVDESRLLPGYVVSFLKSAPGLSQIEFRSTGTVRNTLKFDALCRLELSVPSIDEQQTRLGRLKSIEGQIELRKKYLEKLNDLVKSQFIEMFGDPESNPRDWRVATIGELATDVRYGTSKSAKGGSYKYIRMNNITYDGTLDLTDIKFIDLEGDELKKAEVVKGDLLFNRTNSRDQVGKTCVFNLDEPMVIAGYIVRVRLCPEVIPEYVSGFLNSDYGKRLLRAMAHGAINQANINAAEMQSIAIPVPPAELQEEYLRLLNEVDKLEFAARWGLRKCETACSVIMSELSSTNTVAGEMATGCSKAKGIAGLW